MAEPAHAGNFEQTSKYPFADVVQFDLNVTTGTSLACICGFRPWAEGASVTVNG